MEAKTLIERALEAQYIYNTDDLQSSSLPFYFREPENGSPPVWVGIGVQERITSREPDQRIAAFLSR